MNQKFQYLHNILTKDAQRLCQTHVQKYATSFQEAVAMIETEYSSPVRQARLENYLSGLRLSNFVAQGSEIVAALSKFYKLILNLSRQVPPSHMGDAHPIKYRRHDVIEYEWSHEP